MSAPIEETAPKVEETVVSPVKLEENKPAEVVVDTKEEEKIEDERPVSRDDSDKEEVRYCRCMGFSMSAADGTVTQPEKRRVLTAQPHFAGRL